MLGVKGKSGSDQPENVPVHLNSQMELGIAGGAPLTTVSKSHLVKYYINQAWSNLQFVTFKR